MKERGDYLLKTDILRPMNSFYIHIIDRWLDLYMSLNGLPGAELSLYWNDTGENYRYNMCYGEVYNFLQSLLDPMFSSETIKNHAL